LIVLKEMWVKNKSAQNTRRVNHIYCSAGPDLTRMVGWGERSV